MPAIVAVYLGEVCWRFCGTEASESNRLRVLSSRTLTILEEDI